LQNADKVELGEAVLSADQYSVNTAGTEMTFSAVFATPGVKTLRVSQQDNAQVASMPAAVLVAQAIEIADITTNNVKGGEKALSDSGNNRITVQGLGLQGNLAVHLVPYDQGFIPDSSNLVRHRVQGGQLFIDNSPKVIAGRKYQLVIIRKETEETVFAPQQLLLTGVDDTAPVLLSGSSGHKALTMSEPLRLTFDEPVSAEGYQVIKQFKDYTDRADVDSSNRFELVNIAAQSINLRLLPGQLLDANATYRIVINGIADSAGNLALGGPLTEAGRYSANLTAPDTLAPRNLRLVRLTDGIDVNEAMQLTKGRSHRFMLSAIDNYTAASAINYRYRIATAFGAPETGWLQPGRENVFTFDALEHHVYMEVLVEARDGNNSPVAIQTFRASLRDPVIELESFHTNPAEPEESVRAEMHFTLSGDIDMVGQTVISVDKIKQGTIDASDKYNPVTGHVFASFVNPK